MSRRWQAAAREALLQRRRALTALQLDHGAGEDGVMAQRETDSLDIAAARAAVDALERLNDGEYRELTAIEAAIARIESGDYGLCIDCGDPISQRRLEAVPWTARCLECAADDERERANVA